jgi:two-component system, NtrC family, response regulator GlrR
MKSESPPVTASLGLGMGSKPTTRRKDDRTSPNSRRDKARILVVDTDPAIRRLMMLRLGAANYLVESADCAEAALKSCERLRPNLVITALRMQPMDGLGLLNELKRRWPDVSVIILTACGTIPLAVRATQYGAFSFLVKPIEKSELLGQVERAIQASSFTHNDARWRADIVSRSQLMEDRLAQANRAARSDVSVLLSGENGTGKEMFARAIHAASKRRDHPFIVVNCASADEQKLDEELFGSESDATSGDLGLLGGSLRASRGGTLLLDEIGDLCFRLQIKLSEALREDRKYTGIGAAAPTDVRLVCSTSRDLKKMLADGQFHDELYYRVNVLPIEVPPLGRRREDIPLLISRFLEQAAKEGGVGKIYSAKAAQMLVTANWPGNVRQLFDLVKQNVALSENRVMTEEFVGKSLDNASAQLPSLDDARSEFCHDYLVKNLQSTSGSISRSARLAKRNRTDFYKLLSRYRLQPEEYKQKRLPNSKKAPKASNA